MWRYSFYAHSAGRDLYCFALGYCVVAVPAALSTSWRTRCLKLWFRKDVEVIQLVLGAHMMRDLGTHSHTGGDCAFILFIFVVATVQKLLLEDSLLGLSFPALWATSVF